MEHTIHTKPDGLAAPEARPVADGTSSSWNYATAHRVLETEIPPFSGVAVARFMPADEDAGTPAQILAFAAAAVHLKRGNESHVLFVDAEELGAAAAASRSPDVLALRFAADPQEKGVYKLWRGRFARVNLRDHNSGKENRLTVLMETMSPGGFWAMISFSELGTEKVVVTEKIVPKNWGIPVRKHLVGDTINGAAALPLSPSAYEFALHQPTAWDAVREIGLNLGYEMSHMATTGRNLRGESALKRPERVKSSGGFSLREAVPAATLKDLAKKLAARG